MIKRNYRYPKWIAPIPRKGRENCRNSLLTAWIYLAMSFIIRFSDDRPRIKYFLEILSAEEKSTSYWYLLVIRCFFFWFSCIACNGVQREHNKKLNNGLPILHKVPPKRDYGRYFCIMAEKGGTSHGGLTEKLSPFFHAKKQEVNAYGRW